MMLLALADPAALIEPLSHVAHVIPLAVPDPGSGQAPPGSEKVILIIKWIAWLAAAACVVGVLICGGAMALSHRGHGGGQEHAARLGWALGGCIVIGMAAGLVGALV